MPPEASFKRSFKKLLFYSASPINPPDIFNYIHPASCAAAFYRANLNQMGKLILEDLKMKKIFAGFLLVLMLCMGLSAAAFAFDNTPPAGSMYNSGSLEDSSG